MRIKLLLAKKAHNLDLLKQNKTERDRIALGNLMVRGHNGVTVLIATVLSHCSQWVCSAVTSCNPPFTLPTTLLFC